MKYIKTFDNTSQKLEDIKKLQLSKLAIFKFSKKINELFQKHYNVSTILREEDSNHHQIKNRYDISDSVLKRKTYFSISITPNYKIDIFPLSVSNDLEKFFIEFFDLDSQNYSIRIFCTSEELNDYCDIIVDEFDLYVATKKYNL